MTFEYSKLARKIKEEFGSQKQFATEMGLSERSVSMKLAGKRDWRQKEILRASRLLQINLEEIHKYFFASAA